MIGKIYKNTPHFDARVEYINNQKEEKHARILMAHGVKLGSNKSIIRSFEYQAAAKPSVSKPAGHFSLNFALQDRGKLSDSLMTIIALEYMKRMGIVNTQFLLCRHEDKEHDHLHGVFNRVTFDLDTLTKCNDYRHSVEVCKQLSKEYGLYISTGKENVKEERLKGRDKYRYEMLHTVQNALEDSHSWEDFKEALNAEGVYFFFHYSKKKADKDDSAGGLKKKADGIIFTDTDQKYKFSGKQLDNSLTLTAIDRYFKDIAAKEKLKANYIGNGLTDGMSISGQTSGNSISSSVNDNGIIGKVYNEVTGMVEDVIEDIIDDTISKDDSGSSSLASDIANATVSAAKDVAEAVVDVGSTAVEVISEMALPTNVPSTPSVGGGGSSNTGGWRGKKDDDEDDKKRSIRRKGR